MKYKLFFFILVLVQATSCKTHQLIIKLKNISSEDFRKVHINVSGKEIAFDLKKGQIKTLTVEKSHRYFWMQVITTIDTLKLVPVDYVGEKLFTDGKLKIQIGIKTISVNKRILFMKTKRNGHTL